MTKKKGRKKEKMKKTKQKKKTKKEKEKANWRQGPPLEVRHFFFYFS
jgi:hypothetical protein